jgi:hypothetical protein
MQGRWGNAEGDWEVHREIERGQPEPVAPVRRSIPISPCLSSTYLPRIIAQIASRRLFGALGKWEDSPACRPQWPTRPLRLTS